MGHWYPSSSWKYQGMGAECYIWFVSHVFPPYHPAANSLSSPGTLLLVGTQQGKLFLNTVFLGQLILLKCRQHSLQGKNNRSSLTPKSSSKIK